MELGIALYESGQWKLAEHLTNFSRMEISGEMLDDELPELLQCRSGKWQFSVRELLSRRVLAELPEIPAAMRNELLMLAGKRCEQMARLGASEATLALPADRIANDVVYGRKFKDILLCINGIASRSNVRLICEIRIPENFEGAVVKNREFCRSVVMDFRTLIDFHPHEPGSFNILQAALPALPFAHCFWRLSFEMASCNYLSEEVVRKIAGLSQPSGADGEYMIFAPGRNTGFENYCQLDLLAGKCLNYPR